MNDDECNKIYTRLVEVLSQHKLNWVVHQVEEQLRLGKTIEKEIETLKEIRGRGNTYLFDAGPVEFKKGPRATFPVTVEYHPRERLILLLDAIDQVVVNTALMEQHVSNYFESEKSGWQGIEFFQEEANEPSTLINSKNSALRKTGLSKLESLLKELRSQL